MIRLEKTEALSAISSKTPFKSNDTQVDDFFNKKMLESDRNYHTKTVIYYMNSNDQKIIGHPEIVGFYSSVIGTLSLLKYRDKLQSIRELDAADVENDEGIPVVILHYFGRDYRYSGHSIGKAILVNFLIDVFNASYYSNMGISGVLLDATEDSVTFYESLLFIKLGMRPDSHGRNYTVMFLAMDSIIDLVSTYVDGTLKNYLDLKLELSDLKDEDN